MPGFQESSIPGFRLLEENLYAALSAFAGAGPSGDIRVIPGLLLACAGVDLPTNNAALLTSRVDCSIELGRRIEIAREFFRQRNVPWSFWVCEDWLERSLKKKAKQVFWEAGLNLAVEMPGMAAERIAPPVRPLPQLEYRRVDSHAERVEFNHIMSASFGIPFEISRKIYQSEKLWVENFVGYLGYFRGTAVTTAATVMTPEVVGLYAVATLPPYQRLGYGEAVVRYVLERARAASGIERTVLESTRPGYELYSRMGYKTVTNYAIYVLSRDSASW